MTRQDLQRAAIVTRNTNRRGGVVQSQEMGAYADMISRKAPNTQTVNPIAGDVAVPQGAPMVQQQFGVAKPLEDNFTINIDNKTGKSADGSYDTFIIFDTGKYHKVKTGNELLDEDAIYIDSRDRNQYYNTIETLCGHSVMIDKMQVKALTANNDQALIEQQLSEDIMRYEYSAAGKSTSADPLEMGLYENPFQQNTNFRIVDLPSQLRLINRGTAWEVKVYKGVLFRISLWVSSAKVGQF